MLDFIRKEDNPMKSANIRELTHHFASYLKVVKRGGRIVVMERSLPVADIVPHNENLTAPAWKRGLQKIQVKGETFSQTTIKSRAEE
jgi:antitoxin (DNA-binding transcriptional repressor) of toxin-antitoxin stability system